MTPTTADELAAMLERPGLLPDWCSNAVGAGNGVWSLPTGLEVRVPPLLSRRIARPRALEATAPRAWDPELLELWRYGFLYLRCARTRVPRTARVSGKSVVLHESVLGEYVSIRGPSVVVSRSLIGDHAVLGAGVTLIGSTLEPFVFVNHDVRVTGSYVASHCKLHYRVLVEASRIGAHSALEGGNHADAYPQSAGQRAKGLGVTIGRRNWIGQGARISGGARTGVGVVMAPGTTLFGPVGEHVLLAGTPPRELPIDLNIRHLSAADAFAAGRSQGPQAVFLPAYGEAVCARLDARRVVFDFPEHLAGKQGISENLAHFHAGSLACFLEEAFPGAPSTVEFIEGEVVRFIATFDADLPVFAVPSDELVLRLGPAKEPAAFATLRAVLARKTKGLPLHEIVARRLKGRSRAGLRPPTLEAVTAEIERASAEGVLTPALLPRAVSSWSALAGALCRAPDAGSPPRVGSGRSPGRSERAPDRAWQHEPRHAGERPFSSPIREQLVNLIANVTGRADFKPDAALAAQGVDSLAWSQIAAGIEARFGVEIDVFDHPTIAALASAIRRAGPSNRLP